jgi:peptidoglycan endopeptidase LytF
LNQKKSTGFSQVTMYAHVGTATFYKSASNSKKSRLIAFSLFFITLFSLTTFLQPVAAVRADDNLGVNSQARVANTEGDGVRLRQSATSASETLTIIPENELVTIKSGLNKDKQGNNFYKVDYQGKTGYVMSAYLILAGKATPNIQAVPAGSPAKIINTGGDGVNLRQQASAGSSVLAVLSENTLVISLGGPFTDKQNNSFFRVNYKGQTGYVAVAYVGSAPKNAVTSGGGGYMKVTNTDGDPIRLRSGPGRTFGQEGLVYEGQVVKSLSAAVKDDDGAKWYRIESNSKVGYVNSTFLANSEAPAPAPAPAKPAPAKAAPVPAKTAAPAPLPKVPAAQAAPTNAALGDKIVSFARQYLGWRYVWGGKSPAAGGFDCSGFIYWVLTQNGIRAGSSAAADMGIGIPVSVNALQPGDILIWSNTYMPGPSHIGIYIGGGRFIHAENESSGVTITSMSNPYYASRFTAARRPVA